MSCAALCHTPISNGPDAMNKRGRANITGGDDLVDDWLVEDVGLDSGSDDGAALLEGECVGVVLPSSIRALTLTAWCANPSEADEQKSGDRGATDDANAKEQTEQEKKRKKKQRRKKKKARKSQGKPGAAHDISCASACAQRDFLWTTFKSTVGKDMTEIESGPPPPGMLSHCHAIAMPRHDPMLFCRPARAGFHPPDSAFVSLPSVPRSTLNFANFIKAAVPSFKRSIMWSRNSKRAPGPPTVIVVCSSARRCVELLKYVPAESNHTTHDACDGRAHLALHGVWPSLCVDPRQAAGCLQNTRAEAVRETHEAGAAAKLVGIRHSDAGCRNPCSHQVWMLYLVLVWCRCSWCLFLYR